MGHKVEITPLVRALSCDGSGKARLLFTITNTLTEPVEVRLSVTGEGDVAPGWFTVEDGPLRQLGPRATARIVVAAEVPAGISAGARKLRLITHAAGDEHPAASPSVTLDVVPRAPAPTEAGGGAGADPGKRPGRGFRFPWQAIAWPFRALFGFGARWLLGTQPGGPSGAVIVNRRIVWKALIVLVAVYALSTLSGAALGGIGTNPECDPVPKDEAGQKACLSSYALYRMLFSEGKERDGYKGPTCLCVLPEGLEGLLRDG
ncbi:hypothetical protein DEA8626_03343 [Defluviimonas aquaemixtae]|uniref:Uncharacterized protein n=1 Tax=Albidovulum aquaemixtae TaxID=1542388 RepID=A0A2R8BLQ4_9RHOB|nr:hypothetical protein [Defluviimonas aquaemixtae]SPH24293.1 hypothetical protein DEA8626_03343 [Defluviimonas aquaemixtae]